jgi:glycosyltransferase involved in cell wall biosynthesis
MTQNHGTVSVLIPAHNAELTVLDTLQSVLSQTYPIGEIIVVVDVSTDKTLEIIKSVAVDPSAFCAQERDSADLPEIKIIETEFGSPSLARNAAIKIAGGDFICFLDADDIWTKNKTLLQINCLIDSDCAIACSQWTSSLKSLNETLDYSSKDTDIVTYSDLLVLNRFQTSTVMMKRTCLEKTGYFAAEFDGAEDWEFWIRAAKTSDIARINAELVYYRDNAAGYSKNLKRHYLAVKKIIKDELPKEKNEKKNLIYANCPGTENKEALCIEEIRAWHYLRFIVAFLLIKDYKNSFSTLGDLVKNSKPIAVLPAIRKLLYPFLKHRFTKRSLVSQQTSGQQLPA